MKYGYFDNERHEYVITDPKTPVKWINYIGGLSFGGFVDNTGGALIAGGDPALNRIVKYIPQLPSSSFKGETLYIRTEEEEGGYRLISPFFVPTLSDCDSFECRVGSGYSIFETLSNGIRTKVKIFVPLGSKREIRDITVTNERSKAVSLDIIPLVEYSHFDALKQFTNADWVPQTMQSRLLHDGEYKILTQYAFMKKDTAVNYFTSNKPASSFETDRKQFLGNNGYGTFSDPVSLREKELGNHEAHREDNIASLMHHMGTLESGESKRLITQLGQTESMESALHEISLYRDESEVDRQFELLKASWRDLLDKVSIMTPDEDFNTLVGIHNPKQCLTTREWSRFLSLYQLGLGSRGIGFRDTSQDLMGVMGIEPESTVEMMTKLFSTQRPDGSAMHQFFPLTMEATAGDSAEMDDRPDYYGDDHLWIIQTVSEYLKETGNFDFLDKVISYYDSDEKGSVLDHMNRALEFTWNSRGSHGLPLLGFADWNDTVNLPSGAESIFNANLFGKALLEMIDIGRILGNDTSSYEKWYEEMKGIVESVMWDGEWYARYLDHEGNPLGSKSNPYGSIFTNAQSWTVISGFADNERALTALDSVYRHLNTSKGIKLSTPGFNGYDPVKGGVSTYPPGAKENGGIFLHSNPWVMIAETIMGNGNRAYEYHSQINPVKKNLIIDEFECEPYVFPQNILGDEHPQFGLGRNSWLSGTASWAYQAATKYILGIRPGLDGLIIDPCIPDTWPEYSMKRTVRNVTYNIKVLNPDGVSKGIKKITVNGAEMEGNKIPYEKEKEAVNVLVIMG